MFDFGFSEILVILVLALIVLGPERLPGVVRRVGRWVGRARAMARQFQDQLEEELDLDERRRTAPAEPHNADSAAHAAHIDTAYPDFTSPASAEEPAEPALRPEPADPTHDPLPPHEPRA
jgi:sec-independent protein translocase protein TatB